MKKILLALLLGGTAFAQSFPSNKLKFGDKAASNKIIEADKGLGATNPKMRWNNSSSSWEFSNDGSTYRAIGSGNSGGINILNNFDVEQGTAVGFTSSGGVLADATSGSNLLFGAKSGTFNASATSQYVETSATTIPNILYGRNCLGSFYYLGGDTNLTAQVVDGSANVLVSQALTVTTTPQTIKMNFVCPSSGTIKLKILSSADAAIFAFDQLYLGDASNLTDIGQAQMYGMANWPSQASCLWSTTSSSYGNYSADTDCTTPVGANLAGNASAPATKIPAVTFASLPAGEYYIIFTGSLYKNFSNADNCYFRLHDGTNASYGEHQMASNGVANSFNTISGRFVYTSAQSNITFQIQGKNNGTTGCAVDAREVATTFLVYRFPTSSELAYRPEVTNWKVDANISGANPSLGTSAVSSYTSITNGGLTLTNNSGLGNITAQIPCSSTNPPTGTTCAAGTEDIGVSFTLPSAQDVIACASFSWRGQTGSTSTNSVEATFQIVETPTNAQTISQEGKSRIPAQAHTVAAVSADFEYPIRVCGNFSFSSAGQKVLRLMYEQAVAGTPTGSTVLADANANSGQRDIHWEVYPITQSMPMPILVGGVSSNSSGSERIERAGITCSSSSSIGSQSGTWISSIGNISSGKCTLTLAAGIFSGNPLCVVTANAATGTTGVIPVAIVASSTSVQIGCTNQTSGTTANCTNENLNVICMGPK